MIIREEDVVIIGAGAAGIGAGLALSRLGVPYIILEAKHQVGGRSFTDVETFGRPWDRGCHWLYSADINPLRTIAERLEHPLEDEPSDWLSAIYLGDRWASAEEVSAAHDYVDRGFGRVAAANADISIAEVLEGNGEWADLMRDRVAHFGANEPAEISALDYGRYHDTNVSLAVAGGVGVLFEAMARGLPMRTGCEVSYVGVRGGRVEIEASNDTLVRAGAAIVTVSTEVLRSGMIAFDPSFPDELTAALEGISLGHAEKVAISFRSDPFDVTETRRVNLKAGGDGARYVLFELMSDGPPLAVAHLGGDLARDLAKAGEAEMIDYAVKVLADAYGTDIPSLIVETAATNWAADPYVGGAYSTAMPGSADARGALRQPIGERIFLAGEATSERSFATCHGAYMSGVETAHTVAELLGYKRVDPDPLWLPVFG